MHICCDSKILQKQQHNIHICNYEEFVNSKNKCLCSKFIRYLIGYCVPSVDVDKEYIVFVPTWNFTNQRDVNWNDSVSDIDKQLYAKYNLTEKGIAFIEKMIKSM